ncbi:MAG: GNAT family N-acetyltransferase [Alphaproteobacteria bacterium]|jgi:GNAT superfamily N-acetyltransferase|nr:GNAT family N-acetyltransferase [Alphaproteobacteria bacterium]MBT4018121.1 GNAT family N-acetyltransferase [Alphaproteobacteria bacterium]MBT4965719.1 GNAT family N-acetyltransferase [Alphaproteobacteria bacterium]MBT5158189.1 GNAT family N-acetyltransferase [Alphaproteobacteria bacterium]MBT6385731.1 GNAT family N-acetyltransferase [Alphaproteobacteria bacterium]
MTDLAQLPITPLLVVDAPAAHALSREANWNQTEEDWRLMITTGDAVGLRDEDGRLIASALSLPQGPDFAWLSMILVTADYQRQNIASRLMAHLIAKVQAEGQIPGLDATPAGKPVYQPLGFLPVYELSRWQATEPGWAAPAAVPGGVSVEAATTNDLGDILAYDASCFGGDRRDVIAHLLQRCPDQALLARHDADNSLAGFALARDGRENLQVGPVVADNEQIAIDLLDRVFSTLDGGIYIDVPDSQELLSAWLKSRGFTVQRPFTRMLVGRTEPFDQPQHIFAIAGPELG